MGVLVRQFNGRGVQRRLGFDELADDEKDRRDEY
jgi:hypothetical protein